MPSVCRLTSNVARKRCARCGLAIECDGLAFCSACQEFFQALSSRVIALTTNRLENKPARERWQITVNGEK